jgi:hypothetical protein
MLTTTTDHGLTLRLSPDVAVDVLLSPDGWLTGLGAITIHGTPVRSGQVPMRPLIKSLCGVVYTRFGFERVEARPDGGIVLHTLAHGERLLEGVHGDQYGDLLLWPSANTSPITDHLEWILRPETAVIGDVAYDGLSYAWAFASDTQQIHRIIAQATWELGGQATGNTWLSLGQITPPIYTAEVGTHFTSACLQGLNRFGDPLGMSFQWSSRLCPHQCFDFVASPLGSLVGYWPERADVRSFVQKNPGEDVTFVLDATGFPASATVELPRKCLLFAPAGADGMPDHTMRNRWKDAHDFCEDRVRGWFGITRSRPLPEATIRYSTRLHEDGTLRMRVGTDWVPSQEWLIAMADVYFPELAARGIKRVIPEPIVETDPTERGFIRKLDRGIHGDLDVGSVCCVHRYRPSALWGGAAAWRYYYEKAHELGMEVGHWIGPHLAYHAPILTEHPDWALRGVNTMTYSGGYPSFGMAVLNWNTGVRQWIFEDLKRWREELGLDYLWFDSLGNLGFLPVDYAANMASNAFAIAEFIADLQTIGIANISVEGVSPLGISGAHVFDPNQGIVRHAQDIAGQNTWDWYTGNEDMFTHQSPRVELHRDRSDEEARQSFFRCLANRCVPMFGRFSQGFGPNPVWLRLDLDTYLTVEPHLVRRRLLPDWQGVLWSDGPIQILFAYAAQSFSLETASRIERISGGVSVPLSSDGSAFATEPWSVYRLTAQ